MPVFSSSRLGIRAKLILLFVLIKVVPLLLLALLAWASISHLGQLVSDRNEEMAASMRQTVSEFSDVVTKESTRALDLKSREAIERLTTDTARAVADFLRERDGDILLAATFEPADAVYGRFVRLRTRELADAGTWALSEDKKSWAPTAPPPAAAAAVSPTNAENSQDFNYRAPERAERPGMRPLYHEMTFVGLDGQEQVKVSATDLLPRGLRNVSRKENTYARAETYFAELKKLKPGEIYVSDVIGPYVRSHYYEPVVPAAAEKLQIDFEPEREAYAGAENPVGKRFRGIIRWATPVTRNGQVSGYVTLALDHDHVMAFTDHVMPTDARYTPIADASNGNYAFMWDYLDRSIAHPRHQSIIGFNPETGDYETPWLEDALYRDWQASGKPLSAFLADVPVFDQQSREKKPAADLIKAGIRGLDCRYLNFAPQCHGWHDLTRQGGSGSFVILWSGVWKLTTAATIPYFTGRYGKSPRGFGYVTIGANVDEFHKAATTTKTQLDQRVASHDEKMQQAAALTQEQIDGNLRQTALSLSGSTLAMIAMVIFIAIWLANLLTRRVTYLTDGLRRIEHGELDYRLRKQSNDEMGSLAESINGMADGVQQSFQRLDEAKARAEELSRMKSAFLATMSHELRTPLNGVIGLAQLLEDDLQDEQQRRYAGMIHDSGAQLLGIVTDVLDLAQIEAGRMRLSPEVVALPELVARAVGEQRTAAETKGLAFEVHLAEDLPETLYCDQERLRQVLGKLLDNAVKFTRAGRVDLAIERAGETIRFNVRDTGVGISAEQKARVFSKFHQAEDYQTREHGGAGLGLALADELVRLMGGEIGFESVPEQGSTFFFTLPIQVPPAELPV